MVLVSGPSDYPGLGSGTKLLSRSDSVHARVSVEPMIRLCSGQQAVFLKALGGDHPPARESAVEQAEP